MTGAQIELCWLLSGIALLLLSAALAIEAQRATTTQSGVVEDESAGPTGQRPNHFRRAPEMVRPTDGGSNVSRY